MTHSSKRSPQIFTLAAGLVAMATVAPSAADAQVPTQMRSEALALMQICRADYDRLCSNVQPGGGRILACLQNHANQLSTACAQSMPRAEALKNSAAASGVLPK